MRELGVSKQAAGQLVDTLVLRGYLERSVDPEDRRRLTLTLTERGMAAHLATRGERDFSSLRGLSAAHYDLIAREGGAERARTALERAGLLPAEAPLT